MSRFCATHGWGTWRLASAATAFSPAFEPVLPAQPDLMIRVADEIAVRVAGFAANPDQDRALSKARAGRRVTGPAFIPPSHRSVIIGA